MGSMAKNKNKHKKNDYKALHILNGAYLFLMLIVFPLFFYDHYWDMAFYKWVFFYYVTIGFFVLNIVTATVCWLWGKDDKSQKNNPFNLCDVFAFSYACTGLLTYMTCEDKNAAWMGSDGWYMGFAAQLMLAVLFLFLSIEGVSVKSFLIFQIAGTCVNFFIAILQRYGVNVFYLYWDMPPEVKRDYLSTIGNRGWFTGYVSAVFPLAFFLYWVVKENKEKIACALYLLITSACLLIINTNSIYPSVLAVGIILFIFSIGDAEKIKRLFEINLFWWAADFITSIMRLVSSRQMRELRGVATILQNPYIATGAFLVSVLLWVLVSILKKKGILCNIDAEKTGIYRKAIYICLGAIVVIVICLFIVNTSGIVKKPISAFDITDGWGDNRGFIWKFSWELFRDGNLREKFFGVGQDCLAYKAYSNPTFMALLDSKFDGAVLANAHNEWLNTLVTRGVFGLVTYGGLFVVTAHRCLKELGRNKNILIPAIGLCTVAYMVNNFFGYQQVSATGVIFIEMGIASFYLKNGAK